MPAFVSSTNFTFYGSSVLNCIDIFVTVVAVVVVADAVAVVAVIVENVVLAIVVDDFQ